MLDPRAKTTEFSPLNLSELLLGNINKLADLTGISKFSWLPRLKKKKKKKRDFVRPALLKQQVLENLS